jgi:hypothetical protein
MGMLDVYLKLKAQRSSYALALFVSIPRFAGDESEDSWRYGEPWNTANPPRLR